VNTHEKNSGWMKKIIFVLGFSVPLLIEDEEGS
jgi:hypothetical protein